MDVNLILHMNGGAGEDSYAQNSSWQSDILSVTKTYTEQALVELLSSDAIAEGKIGIADLGCSSGPTALDAMSHMLDVVHDMWRKRGGKSPEVAVYLNDLPGNDFNYLFGSFTGFFEKLKEEKGNGFGPCFVFGAPGSFYGRLFPSQSLHFVHSSTSLHWLSKGKVEEEKVDSLNVPYYLSCPEEIKHLIQTQGSFQVHRLRTFEINWDGLHETEPTQSESKNNLASGRKRITRGEKVARIHRAVFEPIFEYHFGNSIMDELFHRYGMMVDTVLALREPKFTNVVVTLVRKPYKV